MLDFLKKYKKKVPALTEEQKKLFILIGIIACAVLLAAGVAYLVYRLISKKNEDNPDNYEEDPEEDFFEDDEN